MSCYFRHMKSFLDEAGIEVHASNRKEIDQAFHSILGVAYKDCPATWQMLKEQLVRDEDRRRDLIQKLQEILH